MRSLTNKSTDQTLKQHPPWKHSQFESGPGLREIHLHDGTMSDEHEKSSGRSGLLEFSASCLPGVSDAFFGGG